MLMGWDWGSYQLLFNDRSFGLQLLNNIRQEDFIERFKERFNCMPIPTLVMHLSEEVYEMYAENPQVTVWED